MDLTKIVQETPNDTELGKVVRQHVDRIVTGISEYVARQRKAGAYQEMRIAINEDGSGIVHEMNKDSETLNFKLDS